MVQHFRYKFFILTFLTKITWTRILLTGYEQTQFCNIQSYNKSNLISIILRVLFCFPYSCVLRRSWKLGKEIPGYRNSNKIQFCQQFISHLNGETKSLKRVKNWPSYMIKRWPCSGSRAHCSAQQDGTFSSPTATQSQASLDLQQNASCSSFLAELDAS